jgi:feruloyl esterase
VTTRDPGPNKVLFVLVMPDNFNGRYLYLGVGAAAGALPGIPAELSAKGYALAGSDGGTGATSAADFSFQRDPAKSMDYSWRAVHVSAIATQQIARSYYQRESLNRYITGCSGGGQMGLTNAVRFGREDFDGFIVGATPFPGSVHLAQIFRIAQYLQKHPEGWISPDMAKRADAAILARYDDVDGAKDGLIADSRDIGNFDDAVLREVGFTAAQLATFDIIRSSHHYTGANVSGDGFEPGLSISDIVSQCLAREAGSYRAQIPTSPRYR